MNLWQIIALAGAAATPASGAQDQAQPAPPTPQTTWHCTASSKTDAGGMSATIEVDTNGNGGQGLVSWDTDIGEGAPVRIDIAWGFSHATPEVLHGLSSDLSLDLSGKQAQHALRGRKFQWLITTHDGSAGDWHIGAPAFATAFGTVDRHNNFNNLGVDADDFLTMARGGDRLYLIAQDKKHRMLFRRTLSVGRLNAGMTEARKVARQVVDLAADHVKSCERDDHDQADIVV